MTRSGYSSVLSTAGDLRQLTPLVPMSALRRAGTSVLEPVHRFRLEIPAADAGPVLTALAHVRAVLGPPTTRSASCPVGGLVPAARVHALQRRLPTLTSGEGVLESEFDHTGSVTGPVPGAAPHRPRPLERREYLLHVVRRV